MPAAVTTVPAKIAFAMKGGVPVQLAVDASVQAIVPRHVVDTPKMRLVSAVVTRVLALIVLATEWDVPAIQVVNVSAQAIVRKLAAASST